MLKLLVAGGAVPVLRVMVKTGIAGRVLPTSHDLARLRAWPRSMPVNGLEPDPVLRLAALGLESATDAAALRQVLRLSNAEYGRLQTSGLRVLPSPALRDKRAAHRALSDGSTRIPRCGAPGLGQGPGARSVAQGMGRTARTARAVACPALSRKRGRPCQPRRSCRPGDGAASQMPGGLVDGRRLPYADKDTVLAQLDALRHGQP
jgi:hypothetical protein